MDLPTQDELKALMRLRVALKAQAAAIVAEGKAHDALATAKVELTRAVAELAEADRQLRVAVRGNTSEIAPTAIVPFVPETPKPAPAPIPVQKSPRR